MKRLCLNQMSGPLVVIMVALSVRFAASQPVQVIRSDNHISVRTQRDRLEISVCNPSVLHIIGGIDLPRSSSEHTPWIVTSCASNSFAVRQQGNTAYIETGRIQLRIDLRSGKLEFLTQAGENLLSESCAPCGKESNARSYESISSTAGPMYRISERFSLPADEALYGLGQHQSGVFDYRQTSTILSQINTDIAMPFFVSTRGYGLIWNSAAYTIIDNRFSRLLKITSEAGRGLDMYFVYGPDFDQIIHQYRELTGHAPLFPEWAYGLFQSKDRYSSQAQLEEIIARYRKAHIPVDTIVQDWKWWTKWGANTFNSEYPDFPGAVKTIHENGAHVMISAWPKFDPATSIWKEMKSKGYLIPNDTYDATNPAARDLYWRMLPGVLLRDGVDALWLDDAEPEGEDGEGGIAPDSRLYFGPSKLYTNVYPFMHTYGVYSHWRAANTGKRVFLLARSSFLGEQRNGASVWSGDVFSNSDALARQIPAGLNMALSGVPYWTTDIGGYGYPNGDTSDRSYQELFTRWFEFGVFCPIFRVHGHRTNDENELWSYGAATPILLKFDKLRYHLLPYIYSLAWQVTSSDYTIMRPLAMDWRTDRNVWRIGNEFMFGPDLLVNPVTSLGATSRTVYLPASAGWYDFWTGKEVQGAKRFQADAPLDRIPLYVRAGSILPLGHSREYAEENRDGPIEIRVYRGANASFTLYQDAGDEYDYERGKYSTIAITWNDASHVLVIGARQGEYPGMPLKRVFNVVWVAPGHGAGSSPGTVVDAQVVYTGREIRMSDRGDKNIEKVDSIH